LLLWAFIAAIAPDRAAAAGVNDLGRERWVEVTINGVPYPDFALLRIDPRRALFVRRSDINAWHMVIPGAGAGAGPGAGIGIGIGAGAGAGAGADARLEDPDSPIRIDNVPGLHARLERDDTQLNIEAEPSLFGAQFIAGRGRSNSPDHGLPALFADYDLFAARSDSGIRGHVRSTECVQRREDRRDNAELQRNSQPINRIQPVRIAYTKQLQRSHFGAHVYPLSRREHHCLSRPDERQRRCDRSRARELRSPPGRRLGLGRCDVARSN
jgi:hypothetical protein